VTVARLSPLPSGGLLRGGPAPDFGGPTVRADLDLLTGNAGLQSWLSWPEPDPPAGL